jgi:hypothetical protein
MAISLKGRIIAVDFDSTIAHYTVFKGVKDFGDPIQSASWALKSFRELGAMVVIHTCRKEIDALKKWLRENDIPWDHINFSPRNEEYDLGPYKIHADIYIDDKAICFRGEWPDTYRQVINFKRWEEPSVVENVISSSIF